MSFCTQPFNRIEIYENGDVYNCCPPFIDEYSIGNIFETPFEEIWNGEKVKKLRKKILACDYSFCSDLCNRKINNDNNNLNYTETVIDFPEEISISSDNSCNVRCKICRDENFHTEFNKDTLDEEIEKIWLPILKNTKILRFGCSGEPFTSYKERLIIKKTAEKYPNIKFHIHTNGILCNEKLLKDLNIIDKIDTITVSLHSASRWTYNKIIRGGKYDKVMSNLKFLSSLKKDNKINHFRMIFVIYEENYKEMHKFIKLAQKNNAIAEFWALRENNNSEVGKNFEKFSIINPNHKKHNDFLRKLKHPIFDSKNVILYPEIKLLRGKNK